MPEVVVRVATIILSTGCGTGPGAASDPAVQYPYLQAAPTASIQPPSAYPKLCSCTGSVVVPLPPPAAGDGRYHAALQVGGTESSASNHSRTCARGLVINVP